MRRSDTTFASAADVRQRLDLLHAERHAAIEHGVPSRRYWTELRDEIDQTTTFYVAAAVTEIASMRGQLSGRQNG